LKGVPHTKRDHAILDCAWVTRMHREGWPDADSAKKSYYADTRDSIVRKPWGKAPTLKQSQSIYSFERDAVLSGYAHLRLQGWGSHLDLEGMSDAELKSLAGEAFALPPATLMHVAYYMNPFGDWWSDSK
jgi:hypothetical protein